MSIKYTVIVTFTRKLGGSTIVGVGRDRRGLRVFSDVCDAPFGGEYRGRSQVVSPPRGGPDSRRKYHILGMDSSFASCQSKQKTSFHV